MLQQMFGAQLAFPIRVAVAAVVIAALLGLTVLVMRRLAARSGGSERSGRGGPRLAVLESVVVDQRRRLVLVRRDDVEHLLLIGGNSDVVVENQLQANQTEEAVVAAPALAPVRETVPLQRPVARRGLSAAPAAATLPAEPTAASLPAPDAAGSVSDAPAEAREERRAVMGRRPLLRGDGTLSGRPATRTAADSAVDAPPRLPETRPPSEPELAPPARLESKLAAPRAEAPRAEAPRSEAPRTEALRTDASRPDASSLEAPKVDGVRSEAARTYAPEPETARRAVIAGEPASDQPALRQEDPAARLDNTVPRPDDMADRLDAALVQPAPAVAAPQLSLSDLLGETPEKPHEAPAPVRAEPVAESPQVRPSDRPLSRFLSQSRIRRTEQRPPDVRPAGAPLSESRFPGEPRPRVEATPRITGPAEDQGARAPAAPVAEPPPRPREFAFRPAGEPARPHPAEQPRREAPEPRSAGREETAQAGVASPMPWPSAPPVAPVLPAPEAARDTAQPSLAEPSSPVTDHGEGEANVAPHVEPPAAPRDPLDDFDAEMADLLGRSSARLR